MNSAITSPKVKRIDVMKLIRGTDVYDPQARRVGTIREYGAMSSRNLPYAIVSLGSCLGIGEDCRPVPWSVLSYNRRRDAYETSLSEEHLRNAPIYTDESNWDEGRWAARVRKYYDSTPAKS
jgi:hypothetical protein